MIIMKNNLLDDLTDRLLHKSGNNVVDDFMINKNLEGEIMEFVPYNQLEFITKVEFGKIYKIYKATWIHGNIQRWNEKKMNFKRSGPIQVFLEKLNNSENITSKELNEVYIMHFNITKNIINNILF